MSGNAIQPENGPVRTLWSRGEIVFAAAAGALAAGVFVPVPGLGLDILWGCVLSITIAAAYFFPKASSTADLKGFSAMLSGPALLRIGLVGAMCVRVWGGQPAGRLVAATGAALTSAWPLGAALVSLAGAVVLAALLFGACQRITAAAERYTGRIFPLKCVGIRTDVKMGVISERQARMLAEKVHGESRLFSNLAGASLLMRAEGAIEVAAMLGCLVWPFLGGRFGSGAERMAQASAAAAGLTAFGLVPAVVSALAGAYLAGKDSLTLRPAPTGPEASGQTFTLVDQETGQCEDVELLNPDFARRVRRSDTPGVRERVAEFEPTSHAPLVETLTVSAGSAEGYYRQLASRTADALSASPVAVFAAQHVRHLPVTVFVNTAIQLVQEHRSVLLVDADTRRHALAQVFEADASAAAKSIVQTAFEGLALCGIGDDPLRTKALLETVSATYGCVLVYAPDAGVQGVLEQVFADRAPTAFVFGASDTAQRASIASTLHYCRRLVLTPDAPMQGEADGTACSPTSY